MKTIRKQATLLLLLMFCVFNLSAQNTKGLKTGTGSEDGLVAKTGTIRAVVVGVSDYADEGIPDLQYAHKDAQAFAEYLGSSAGGGLNPDNIKAYYNEEATGGNVHKALNWLVTETQENDLCIIYFSGHGDVETIYEEEPGHFLVHDSPSTLYQINSLRVADLNNIITTLSSDKNAQVHVYTDACRSGKLAGSDIKGAQATAAALNKQFANEIKIMSCQANEFSLENEIWGGGRGIFSYHLIEGMTGLADNNGDKVVNLKEIQRYLEDEIELSLESHRQTPISIGDRYAKIAVVDEESLGDLLSEKSLDAEPVASLTSKEQAQPKANEQILLDFYAALEADNLLKEDQESTASIGSAEELYMQIIEDPSYQARWPVIKGDFIGKLQDDAHQAIYRYLSVDLKEMKKRWKNNKPEDYAKYAAYLEKAASLMEPYHYLYPQLKSKQIYFEVVDERLSLEINKANPEAYLPLSKRLEEALVYEKRGPFIHNEMGWLFVQQKRYEEAIEQFKIVIEMSPQWVLPYNNISYTFLKLNNEEQAIDYANKSIKINNQFISPYLNLSEAYVRRKEFDKAIETVQDCIELNPQSCHLYNAIGYYYQQIDQAELAFENYNQAISCDPTFGQAYINIAILKNETENAEAAIEVLENGKEAGIQYPDYLLTLGYYYSKDEKFEQAKKLYLEALQINPDHNTRKYLALLYLDFEQADKAIIEFNNYLEKTTEEDYWARFDLACAYAKMGNLQKFEQNLLMAAEGIDNKTLKKEMEESIYLSSIRSSKEYQNILSGL